MAVSRTIVVAGAGIGGLTAALALKSLNDQKASLLQQQSTLTSEVNLATGLSTGIGSGVAGDDYQESLERTLPAHGIRYQHAPALGGRRTGIWRFSGPETPRVVSGDGPCNRERLAARRKAHDDGAWVRAAAEAYAAKRAGRAAGEQVA